MDAFTAVLIKIVVSAGSTGQKKVGFSKKTEPNLTLQLNYTQFGRERLILQIESAKFTEFFWQIQPFFELVNPNKLDNLCENGCIMI
jgi:hypothetical protein